MRKSHSLCLILRSVRKVFDHALNVYIVQYKVIKWQLYVTPKKFPDKGVFPFENGVKNGFFPYYLSFRAQKRTATRIAI